MAGYRSPLFPLGLSGYSPPAFGPALRSPLFLLGFSGYEVAAQAPRPGMFSLAAFWMGGAGSVGSSATGGVAADVAIWRPIFQSGTRRR
jgi:hypothetical protein